MFVNFNLIPGTELAFSRFESFKKLVTSTER